MSSAELLAQLNRQQSKAVKYVEGPLLILAGAGSGKTRTIIYRIAYLISQGYCSPDEVLAVTFTNKAADEMRSRVELLAGGWHRAPLICTFHSFGVRILRKHAPRLDYRNDFAICDVDDQKRLIRNIYKEKNILNEDLPLEKTRAVISKAKNRRWDPEAYLKNSKDIDTEAIYEVYNSYQQRLRSSNCMDFDDLILLPVRLLQENPDLQSYYGKRYRFLLIDEYQDTNPPQYDLIRLLTKEHQNVCAVGDEDQSIYGFRGADISNILRFESDFPGTKLIKLEQNYRSTQNILDAATAVVSNNIERKDKVLWTEADSGDLLTVYVSDDARGEAEFVARTAYQHKQEGISRQAVLYRTNFQSRQFEEAFHRYGIEYRLVGSVSFYQRKEIKDAISFLRLILNPEDDAAFTRILNEPPRGIGQKTRSELFKRATETNISQWDALNEGLAQNSFTGRSHKCLERFRDIVLECQKFMNLPLQILLEKILEITGYMESLKNEDSEDSSSRIQNLHELINVAKEYSEMENPFQQFLDHIALRAETDDYDANAEITLMTLHNAKGLEFPVVYLAGCEDGLFPHSRAIVENDLEEERRLCYVGMTRAEQLLYLTYSRRRRFYGRDSDELNQPSRFLHEIPSKLIKIYESAPRYSQSGFNFGERSIFSGSNQSYASKTRSPYQGKSYNSIESVKEFLNKRNATGRKKSIVTGSIVEHERFGRGRVLKVEETGSDLKVTVQFPGLGIKKLLQSYAKLKRV